MSEPISRAAALIRSADGLLIAAGAGMGVDSGLADFRGTAGFWRAYPALAKSRMRFESDRITCRVSRRSDPRPGASTVID